MLQIVPAELLDMTPKSCAYANDSRSSKSKSPYDLGGRDQHGRAPLKPTIGVLGTKGGVGASTVALNLAIRWTDMLPAGSRVALVDANLQQPDTIVMLNAEIKNSLLDLISKAGVVDRTIFDACWQEVPGTKGKLGLVAPPINGQAILKADLSQLSSCLHEVEDACDLWIIDLPKQLDGHLVSMLDRCHLILLVLEPNLPSISSTFRWLSYFEQLGRTDEEIIAVLNRSGSGHAVESKLGEMFPTLEILKLPDVLRKFTHCLLHGQALVSMFPKEKFTKATTSICQRLDKYFWPPEE